MPATKDGTRPTRAMVKQRIKGLPTEQAKAVVCALVGHSRIQTTCFGYFYCARCDAQVGDTLGSVYDASRVVIVGHDCKTCRENATSLSWTDTLLVEAAKGGR